MWKGGFWVRLNTGLKIYRNTLTGFGRSQGTFIYTFYGSSDICVLKPLENILSPIKRRNIFLAFFFIQSSNHLNWFSPVDSVHMAHFAFPMTSRLLYDWEGKSWDRYIAVFPGKCFSTHMGGPRSSSVLNSVLESDFSPTRCQWNAPPTLRHR